jgi:membrane associated rhomboid family serine protease
MLPIRDDNPTLRPPLATYGLIAVNVAVWILFEGMGAEPRLTQSVCALGLIPAEFLARWTGLGLGAVGLDPVCPLGSSGSAVAPLTSMFTHGSWLHLIGNMWFLHIFGNNVEDVMGRVRFVAFYVLAGLVAAGAQVIAGPGSLVPMVGASGAIGGVMGSYILLYPRAGVRTFVFLGFWAQMVTLPAFVMLGYWFLLQLLSGSFSQAQGGGVAFWAHVGGFLAGFVLTPLFRNPRLLAQHRAATAALV